eukprot:182464_1
MAVHMEVERIEIGVDETDTVTETSAGPVPVHLGLESIRLQKDCPTFSSATSGSDSKSSSSTYVPPGIRAVETLANIRSEIYSLPYGDQVISLLKNVFDFLGGYPDQCLMEDYELVTFIRRRAAFLPAMMEDYCLETNCEIDDEQDQREALAWEREEVKIIPGRPSLCAIRRWQKFGVAYVTFMNYNFVTKYRGGM